MTNPKPPFCDSCSANQRCPNHSSDLMPSGGCSNGASLHDKIQHKKALHNENELNAKQQKLNERIIRSLNDISEQNKAVLGKIDHLEATLTKKATTAGAVAGAVAGGSASVLAIACMEFVKTLFGG